MASHTTAGREPTPSSEPDALPEPGIDERLIMPETRYEAIDGEVVYVSPAKPPHATCHSRLSALLEAHCRADYQAASDMLTRTSALSDVAPDGSIYPRARHPETGERQLEELSFEVVSKQSLALAGRKAASLRRRGVRRVFGLDVAKKRVLEWSTESAAWEPLPDDAVIEDPVLVTGLRVHDLVVASSADDAVARALLAKDNDVLRAELDRRQDAARAEARAAALADALLAVLEGRGLSVSEDERARILALRDAELLMRHLAGAATCSAVADLLD